MTRHILHLARLYSPHRGGVETHVEALAKIEIAQGNRVTVITTQNDPNLPLQEICDGVEIKRIPFKALQSKWQTWKWMMSQKAIGTADIVQIHDVFWWIWPVYFSVRTKLFMTFHGWEGTYPIRWQAKLQRSLANRLSRGSIHVGAWIQEFYGDKPTAVIYGGIDEAVLQITMHQPEVIAPKLVFIGRLEAANDIELYLALFNQLKQRLPKLEIDWIGDGPYRAACEKVGKVWGMIDSPWAPAKDATLVGSNSYLSMLNSLALGKVVISLYSNPLKRRYLETFPGYDYLLVGDQVSALTEQISNLLADPESLIKKSQAAREFAKTQTWAKVAQVYETVWSQK